MRSHMHLKHLLHTPEQRRSLPKAGKGAGVAGAAVFSFVISFIVLFIVGGNFLRSETPFFCAVSAQFFAQSHRNFLRSEVDSAHPDIMSFLLKLKVSGNIFLKPPLLSTFFLFFLLFSAAPLV